MKSLLFMFLVCSLVVSASLGAPKGSEDYSKRIVGRWLGSRKFVIFHSNGTWGVQRNEDAPEDIDGRRWHTKGNKLFLTFRGDHGFQTAEFIIVSFAPKRFTTEADGHKEVYDRAP